MNINPRKLVGSWDDGYALDKHTVSSVYIGDDDNGHPQFDTIRTDAGEAVFQLKYRSDWPQAARLAHAIATHIVPRFGSIDTIVPMPASNPRPRQPVVEIANELGKLLSIPVTTTLLAKGPTPQLKNLSTRAEKDAVLEGAFSVSAGGRLPAVLIVDDLFHTGASMDAACKALRSSGRVGRIYTVACTWR